MLELLTDSSESDPAKAHPWVAFRLQIERDSSEG